MQLDAQCLFSDDQDLSQTVATYLCSNSYDLGTAGVDALGNTIIKDIGRGNVPHLLVQVTETFTSGGAATVDFQLITDTVEAMTSPTVIATTGAIGYATLVAGYQARLAIPAGIAEQFIGVQYVIAGATTTAGKATAGLVALAQTNNKV